MDVDQAIEKARKLLALAESDNAHEAAQAARRAQELLDRYEITRAMLGEHEGAAGDDEHITNTRDNGEPLFSGGSIPVWASALSRVVAEVNQCCAYSANVRAYPGAKPRRTIQIVGRHSDVRKVRYLYTYLCKETDRLCTRDGKGLGRTWRNNYRHGVVHTLTEALKQAAAKVEEDMRQEYAADSVALVRLESALATLDRRAQQVSAFVAERLNLRFKSHRHRSRPEAWEKGRQAGREIAVGDASGALGDGAEGSL